MQDRQRDAFPIGDNLIAQFFNIQSELSDQQRERLTSAMSLRNISLENYSYEMLKTHYHELFITTRTTMKTFWVLEENDAFIARKVSGRNFKFKKRKGKGQSGNKKGSPQRGGFKPFRKSGSGGKANMANENYDPYDQAYWGKGKGKKGNKGKSKFQYMMETKVIHPSGKGKSGQEKGKSKTFAATAEKTEEQPAIQQTAPSIEPTYAGWTDQDWDQSWTWNEHGWHSSHEISSAGQALIAFHDAYEYPGKKAAHEKLIQFQNTICPSRQITAFWQQS